METASERHKRSSAERCIGNAWNDAGHFAGGISLQLLHIDGAGDREQQFIGGQIMLNFIQYRSVFKRFGA